MYRRIILVLRKAFSSNLAPWAGMVVIAITGSALFYIQSERVLELENLISSAEFECDSSVESLRLEIDRLEDELESHVREIQSNVDELESKIDRVERLVQLEISILESEIDLLQSPW